MKKPQPDPLSSGPDVAASGTMAGRFMGIDVGADTIKLVELEAVGDELRLTRQMVREHGKKPGLALVQMLAQCDWAGVRAAAVTGRLCGQVNLPKVPTQHAMLRGFQFKHGNEPATLINIGSHGFSVLEIRDHGRTLFRENSRCSQGTGNFLRQLVERFSLTVEEAGRLCADVAEPAPLSGRCPVILKTDMTHLANKGEDRGRILAGLFDAVCENVLVLLKPGVSPRRVLLLGGVTRSPRVRRVIGETLARQGMELLSSGPEDAPALEALGCALVAAGHPVAPPSLSEILLPPRELKLESLPGLAQSLPRVHRLPLAPSPQLNGQARRLVLGFDIGSTGAKVVAMDSSTEEPLWDAYRQTLGDPVGAAQDLLRRFTECPAARYPVVAFGATGSGREIAGSLLTSCYGKDAVFIVNELVAHATGALYYDGRVDTIFEIGGQDAKYIRLAEGRIIDCAMNEACSAGTGSFIEEQGRKFTGIQDVRQLGQVALAARSGVSLGQHCSVFMAELIDEGVAAGIEEPSLISGLYDSIIKNYLNRVKGNRSVGKRIFCQGMPFAADALAAAVARQTGGEVVVPPNPGTVGALGIALLACRELRAECLEPLDLNTFLGARMQQKDSFLCRATTGCGGAGNRCRIERLRAVAGTRTSTFTWGGGCALHDKATRKHKLPDLAPDPFRERDILVHDLIRRFGGSRGRSRIALTDEFVLKGLFPFFAAFFHYAGFDLEVAASGDQAALKRGIQSARVPFCAPMQLFHGVAERMVATEADWIFIPMLRSLPRPSGQPCSVVCPIVQSAPDVVGCALRMATPASASAARPRQLDPAEPGSPRIPGSRPRLLTACVDFGGEELNSAAFVNSLRSLARRLGLATSQWREAWQKASKVQHEFDANCRSFGERALQFCRVRNLVPVVVLGRNYTIHNLVLNSNVPAILREQGAIGIPVDCYPLEDGAPFCPDMYWGYGQNILRAAHQVRRAPGVYALYCSNYSCGPDSFSLHFGAYVMEGKPFAIIETDGHSGDAGTKTRVEAFLHCVQEDRREPRAVALNNFAALKFTGLQPCDIGCDNGTTERVLIPWVGTNSEAAAAVLRGVGFATESLPPPDVESMRQGRRHTSGKECLPMPLTLGTLLVRLERAGANERFVYLMPSTCGPCRFGVYNSLNQIVLQRLGWHDRIRIWSPSDGSYFRGLPAGTEILLLAGFAASDALLQGLLDVRPFEPEKGASEKVYQARRQELLERLEQAGRDGLSLGRSMREVATGRLFGIRNLLDRAGRQFAALRGPGERPVVELTGEIYLRAVPFSNDFLIEKLESRGLRVRMAPQTEWLDYCAYLSREDPGRNWLAAQFSKYLQAKIETTLLGAMAPWLGWPTPPTVKESLASARPYLSSSLHGEAVLTIGASLEAWRRGQIDAVLSAGPLECMPTKIAEAQFHHLNESEGLPSLTLAFNGEPVGGGVLDNFAFEVLSRFRQKKSGARSGNRAPSSAQPPWKA